MSVEALWWETGVLRETTPVRPGDQQNNKSWNEIWHSGMFKSIINWICYSHSQLLAVTQHFCKPKFPSNFQKQPISYLTPNCEFRFVSPIVYTISYMCVHVSTFLIPLMLLFREKKFPRVQMPLMLRPVWLSLMFLCLPPPARPSVFLPMPHKKVISPPTPTPPPSLRLFEDKNMKKRTPAMWYIQHHSMSTCGHLDYVRWLYPLQSR